VGCRRGRRRDLREPARARRLTLSRRPGPDRDVVPRTQPSRTRRLGVSVGTLGSRESLSANCLRGCGVGRCGNLNGRLEGGLDNGLTIWAFRCAIVDGSLPRFQPRVSCRSRSAPADQPRRGRPLRSTIS
jgi:hypothetical protein